MNNPEESTFIRADSIKSSSWLRLVDVLSQNIILHPFVALRRSCQVNRKCSPFVCVQPFSLIPFTYRQQRKQGFAGLYKGLSSELLVKGMCLGTETALANYADWPREVSQKRYIEDSCKVLVLRGLSVAACTPFLCTSVIETVQSVIITKDRPSFLDCLRDGLLRLLHLKSTPSNRMLPIWLLVIPTVIYHVSYSAIWNATKKCIDLVKNCCSLNGSKKRGRYYSQNLISHPSGMRGSGEGADSVSTMFTTMDESNLEFNKIESDSNQISTCIISSLLTDIALLPFETVLNCLYIQGTRTIIDNCDEKTVVLPVLTNYDGFSDCYQSIMKFEGPLGLYKGLGAIILQYSIHFLIFRSLYYLLAELETNKRSGEECDSDRKAHLNSIEQRVPTRAEYLRNQDTVRHSTPLQSNDFSRFEASLRYGTPESFDRFQ